MLVSGPSPLIRGFLFTALPLPTATILVIDEEQIARGVAYRILSEEGYRVLEAETCAETFDTLRLAHGRVDLLLVDVVMPECDGVAVGRHVLEQWPDQRILYISAHPAEALAERGLSAPNISLMAKPYTREEVLAKVKQVLETASQRKRILVVDDQPSLRSALGKMLTLAGYEVILAADGAEATRLWRERPSDLVIVDLFMPEKDGIETIVELRAFNPGIPIIAMSGGGLGKRVDMLRDARLLGAIATIEKPFEKEALMDLVARSLVGAPS